MRMDDNGARRKRIRTIIARTEDELATETRPVVRAQLEGDVERLKGDLRRLGYDAPDDASEAVIDRLDGIAHILLGLVQVTDTIAEGQRASTRAVLAAIEDGRVDESEQRQLHDAMRTALPLLRNLPALQSDAAAVAALREADKDMTSSSVDLHTRLKVSVPLIPLILSVEQEIDLGSHVDLRGLWDKLTGKTRRTGA